MRRTGQIALLRFPETDLAAGTDSPKTPRLDSRSITPRRNRRNQRNDAINATDAIDAIDAPDRPHEPGKL